MKTANNDLMAALRALMALDVNGRSPADRLQFSDAGRALLDQCRAALDASMHADWCASFAVPFVNSSKKATCDCFMQRKTPTNKILIDRALVEHSLHVANVAEYPPRTLIAALKAALEQPNECHWYQDGDEDSDKWAASCGRHRYFQLNDGTPTDNHMTHCCYCGKPLVEVPIEPEDNYD